MGAAGSHSCVIHYAANDKVLARGQLLKMDAGCELWGYVSDVTRTWPVGGTFSSHQRAVYDVVLDAHSRCEEEEEEEGGGGRAGRGGGGR